MNRQILQYLVGGLLTFLTLSCSEKKNDNPFYIKTYNLTDSLERLDYLSFIDNNQLDKVDINSDIEISDWSDTLSLVKRFFENDDYQVIGTSMGEFGGSIIFSDKKSDLCYFLNCMDPLMVDYKDGFYYVTEQFCGVDFGGTRILKIKDPTSLIKLHRNDLPKTLRQRNSIREKNSEFIKRLDKEIVLIDTANVTASVFYPYKGRNFLIYSAMNDGWVKFDEIDTTFLGEIVDGSLLTLDIILNEPTWTMEFEPSKIINGIYVYKYSVDAWNGLSEKFIETKGQIFVKGDTIIIGHKHRDDRKRRPSS